MMFLTRKRNKRSNVNLSHVSPTTLAPGNLVPISFVRILANDSVSFRPKAFVQAMPMNAPLVNGFKLCLEYFFIPDRLYNYDLSLDFMGVTDDPDSVKYPTIKANNSEFAGGAVFNVSALNATFMTNSIVSAGSLADYMGFPVGFLPYDESGFSRFQATKMVGYLDVIYHYYVNQQIDKIPTAYWLVSDEANVNQSYEISAIENLLKLVKLDNTGTALDEFAGGASPAVLGSWEWLCSRASIFQRCLPPYYLESWLNTSGYNASEILVDLESEGNSISFRNIAAQSHVQRWMDLAMSGGSRYSDYINAQFDCSQLKHTSVPLYLGSDRQMLGSNVIYQTTGAGDSASPLGAFAGQCAGGETFKKRTYKFGEPGYFMVMASLVPDVIYTLPLDPFLRQLTLGDTYASALDNISMQPLMEEDLNANGILAISSVTLDNETPAFSALKGVLSQPSKLSAVGFVPAFSELMQQVSRAHGRLTTDLRYWLLGRRYGFDSYTAEQAQDVETFLSYVNEAFTDAFNPQGIETFRAFLETRSRTRNYSPYINCAFYNDVFADTSPYAENFVLTFAADMYATRDKAKVNTPTTI